MYNVRGCLHQLDAANNLNGGKEIMSDCQGNCSSCSEECSERQAENLIKQPHKGSNIKKVIGVVSGKGGVGKSMVTSQLAVLMKRKGYNTAIMDADITGPSIPKSFGVSGPANSNEEALFPSLTKNGIKLMSMNLLLENDAFPVVWRGPVISGAVTQFWTDVVWGDVDFMFVDMPPGTGDVPLTVFQSLPVDGIIVVTSPQELVSMVVEKAVNMAEMMKIPVIGVVENLSYVECPDCGKKINIFGEGKSEQEAVKHGLELLAKMPIDPQLASLCDKGEIEEFKGEWLGKAIDKIEKI